MSVELGEDGPKLAKRLQDDEQQILTQQIAGATSYLSSTRFVWSCTSSWDGIILIISALAAIVGGAVTPAAMVCTMLMAFLILQTANFYLIA